MNTIRVGIDIGGTFTDFVADIPGRDELLTFKLLSTPSNPADAVFMGLERLRHEIGAGNAHLIVIHGSTVATNALLERKGARTALVATAGFGDVLQIGRQNRPSLYDFFADPLPALVPENLRLELDERVDPKGVVLQPLAPEQLDALLPVLSEQQVQSVAVCLLFSFVNPEHERRVADRLRSAGYQVSTSYEVLPEFREYERASTTTVNAYVSPVLDRYLESLEDGLSRGEQSVQLQVMQSNGGSMSVKEARRSSVHCILSGPAGGVVGAGFVAKLGALLEQDASPVKVITLDMGGTSTDVSLIDGEPGLTTEAVVGGCPIRIPLLDIHTIGAGGGSIARVDPGGALRVGPESAGADPGPACYGRGVQPTVTDANLVLGRLASEFFLGGEMLLDAGAAYHALENLGRELGINAYRAALGVVEVVNAHMERALRVISVERGYDPRIFALLSFGGAGGLHAVDLARVLGINRVLVPPLASTLSAFGMLAADKIKDAQLTVMLPGDTPFAGLHERAERLVQPLLQELADSSRPQDKGFLQNIQVDCSLDLRYRGQSYELTVPLTINYRDDFHLFHQRMYGYANPQAEIEIVNIRARCKQKVLPPKLNRQRAPDVDSSPASLGSRQVYLASGMQPVLFFRGERLSYGNRISGPAVIVRSDTTILVGEQDQVFVDPYLNLLIQVNPGV